MKASELRINNLVYGVDEDFNRSPVKIGVDDLCDMECSRDYEDDYEPIPLTAEWLEKFGFKKVGYNFEKEWLLLHGNLKTGTVDFLLNEPQSGKYKATALEYVHQLQNLYFALTGEELTIKEDTK